MALLQSVCASFATNHFALKSTACLSMLQVVLVAAVAWSSMLTAASAQSGGDSLPLVFDDGNGNTLLYRLFMPPGHDEPGAKFPLTLFMHGSGQTGTDNISQLLFMNGLVQATQSERFASFLLAPQVQPGQGGWGSLTRGMTLQVMQQLEQQYGIDTDRRYVTGLSMGGFGTWDFVADYPELFEAAVPMSSWGNTNNGHKYLDTRVWSFHGRNDDLLAQYDRETIVAIREAGGSPLYTETNGYHVIWQPIYDDPDDDLYPWMFEGVTPSLATLKYNPQDGSVKVDADLAPGGVINRFRIYANPGSLRVPSTIVVDGVTVDAGDFLSDAPDGRLAYDDRQGSGFSGEIDFGPILPPGLDYFSLHEIFIFQEYLTPSTSSSRQFSLLVVEVPEPSAWMLSVLAGFLGISAMHRK